MIKFVLLLVRYGKLIISKLEAWQSIEFIDGLPKLSFL